MSEDVRPHQPFPQEQEPSAAEKQTTAPGPTTITASSELIQRWIDELPIDGRENLFNKVYQARGVLPLHDKIVFYLWVLRADGVVLRLDHRGYPYEMRIEEDPEVAYAALAHGAATYRELIPLLPPRPASLEECSFCDGRGWTKLSNSQDSDPCVMCCGLGAWFPDKPKYY